MLIPNQAKVAEHKPKSMQKSEEGEGRSAAGGGRSKFRIRIVQIVLEQLLRARTLRWCCGRCRW